MEEHLLNAIAVRVLEVWLLSLGFQPSGGWDANDPNCFRNGGTHLIWSVCARMPDPDADMDVIWEQFQQYLADHNAVPGAVRFEPYELSVYECPCGCGTYLFASIYQ